MCCNLFGQLEGWISEVRGARQSDTYSDSKVNQFLHRVAQRPHLGNHGRFHSRRVVDKVLQALGEFPMGHRLVEQT